MLKTLGNRLFVPCRNCSRVQNAFVENRHKNLVITSRHYYSYNSSYSLSSSSFIFLPIKMHQSKISMFFKKSSTSSPTSSPVKKPEPKPKALKTSDDEEDKVEKEQTKNRKSSTKAVVQSKKEVKKEVKKVELKSGKKRKSKTSSEEEDEDPKETKSRRSSSKSDKSKDKSSSAKRKASESNGNKKPRRRILVQDSSSEGETETRMEVEDEPEPVKEKSNGNGVAKNKNGKKSKSSESEDSENDDEKIDEVKVAKTNGEKKTKLESTKEKVEKAEKPTKAKPEPKKTGRKKSLSPKSEKEVNGKGRNSNSKKIEPKKEESDSDAGNKGSNSKEDDQDSKAEENDNDSKAEKDEDLKAKGDDEDSKTNVNDVKAEKDEENGPKRKPTMATMGGGASSKGWKSDYNPAKTHYHPIDDASWERGEKVPYLALAKTLEVIEATSSRLKFVEILANYFRSVIVLSPEDLLYSVYLCLNKLAPAYEGIELGVAETNIMKAIAQATGRSLDKIKSDAGTLGDLGLVAESSRSSQKTLFQPNPLTVSGVFHKLKDIAAMHGNASQSKKISMITSMLVACKYSEARYLTRSLAGKLRIGLAEQSLLQALAQATYLTPPDQDLSEWPPKILNAGKKMSADGLKSNIEKHAFIVKSSFCDCPNYDILVKALIEVGIDGLEERCKLTPGIPPRPMLAQPTKGVADVLERFDGVRFTCEYKYDGERAQIHLLEDGSLNIYSRNQENNTSKYPDIITRFNSCIKTPGSVKSCILDSEAVAWDLDNKMILPFQVLSTRKRKDANEAEIKVQVCVFAFDLIYLNGKSLIKEPLFKRRELLREHFQEVTGEFVFATSLDTDSMEEVQEFLEESIKGNCEGLMVKTLDERATYELAKRSQKWLKLKKDYMDCGGDSLDLVVIGGFYGKGKRAGTYGGFLLACYDPDEEAYQTICKLGTGFSDEQLQSHSEFLKSHVIPNPKSYYRYNSQLTPDQWFDAVQVWEVKCADLSLSPVHTAAEGIADPQRGVSLRFPRFLRIRDDKNVEDATSSQQVSDLYKNQEQVKNASGKKGDANDEDEFY